MTQNDKKIIEYKNNIIKTLEDITDNLSAYSKVDATLSENTLMKVNAYLMAANRSLESGFVKDACNEINEVLKFN